MCESGASRRTDPWCKSDSWAGFAPATTHRERRRRLCSPTSPVSARVSEPDRSHARALHIGSPSIRGRSTSPGSSGCSTQETSKLRSRSGLAVRWRAWTPLVWGPLSTGSSSNGSGPSKRVLPTTDAARVVGYLEAAGVVETALFRSDVADVVARVDTGEDLEAERVRGRDLDHRQRSRSSQKSSTASPETSPQRTRRQRSPELPQ